MPNEIDKIMGTGAWIASLLLQRVIDKDGHVTVTQNKIDDLASLDKEKINAYFKLHFNYSSDITDFFIEANLGEKIKLIEKVTREKTTQAPEENDSSFSDASSDDAPYSVKTTQPATPTTLAHPSASEVQKNDDNRVVINLLQRLGQQRAVFYTTQPDDQTTELDNLRDEIAALKKQRAEQQDEITVLREENDPLKKQIEALKQQKPSHRSWLKAVEEQRDSTVRENEKLETKIKSLQMVLTERNKTINDLGTQVYEAQVKIKQLTDALNKRTFSQVPARPTNYQPDILPPTAISSSYKNRFWGNDGYPTAGLTQMPDNLTRREF